MSTTGRQPTNANAGATAGDTATAIGEAAPTTPTTTIRRLLVANRGEIAVRVMRTARTMEIATVAVFSDADRHALHVDRADEAVRIGPAAAADSYLHVRRIVDAAVRSGCDALHPGYGFLSENPALAEACADAGIVFVGPTAAAIAAMGDKIRAKRTVAGHGVPVVPGCVDTGLDDAAFADAILAVGLPVLLKPSAGGGGKGMRLVRQASELAEAIAASRREALRSFGSADLLAERAIVTPRHVEIQVAADLHGAVVHLGERECSLQRRHQKVIEEAPSPFVTAEMRERMGAHAVAAARACGYTNVGTVEFILPADAPDEFFFIEMNTRLQVEHAVTEMVTGIDLVELQLRIAQGEPLPTGLDTSIMRGHAIEARVYAEDPATGFLPTGGTVAVLREPHGPGVRVDSGLRRGTVVGSEYDPMLAKVIAHGSDRATALHRLDAALGRTTILGVGTNISWLRALLNDPLVAAGALDTELIDRSSFADHLPGPPDDAVAAAMIVTLGAAGRDPAVDPWERADGWRLGGRAPQRALVAVCGGPPRLVEVCATRAGGVGDGGGAAWSATITTTARTDHGSTVIDPAEPAAAFPIVVEPGDGEVRTTVGDLVRRYDLAVDTDGSGQLVWLGSGGATWVMEVRHRWTSSGSRRPEAGDGTVASPLPGTVLDVRVSVGERVAAGQVVAIVEAMKMEHPLRAALDGIVAEVCVTAGSTVTLGQRVVEITPSTTTTTTTTGTTDTTGDGAEGEQR